MSILISIIQAILQAIFAILPLSESAHSAAFHEFAHKADGSVSALTGIIHIAIAVGIIVAYNGVFMKLGREFFMSFSDIAKRNIKGSEKKPVRRFMYFTLISFAVLLLWLIPFGDAGFLFTVLHRTTYNATLLDEGIMLCVTAIMVLSSAKQINGTRNNGDISLFTALFVGFATLFFLPVGGFSLVGGIFAMLIIFGVEKRTAFRYAFVVSAPVFLVLGIVETCIGEKVGVVAGILAAIIGVVISFVCVKVFKWLVKDGYYKYLGIYDAGVGFLFAIIGIFQLALN
ncbi:MAG: undecaprenyl-diphosphate phosphatase [Eubacterium sp.]|nr:undecaprenyl-diphosphate phosphatase [Eubacterium sp.]